MLNSQLIAEVTNKIGFLGDMETDMLAEAFAKASKAGLDTNAIVRNLFAKHGRLDLPTALAALNPPETAAGSIPYHLPDCRCQGAGWIDTDEFGEPSASAVPSGFVGRCPAGSPIGEATWLRWRARQAKAEPRATALALETVRAANADALTPATTGGELWSNQ